MADGAQQESELDSQQIPRRATSTPAIVFFSIFAVAVLWAVGKILAPFFTAILLAAIVVTFTFPVYRRVRHRLKGNSTRASILMLLFLTVVVILPTFFLITLLVGQATDLFRHIQQTDVPAVIQKLQIRERLAPLARVIPGFDPATIKVDVILIDVIRRIPGFVATHGGVFLAGLVNIVVGFILMLLASFYLYMDGERLMGELRVLSPLPDEYDRAIFLRFREVVEAVFRGQMLTALAQGTVTAIGLWIAGIPGWAFWGAVAAVFSLIPMVGAAAVWVPATIYLFLSASIQNESYGWAIFLLLWGAIPVSLIDNVIRPWAMHRGAKMPAVVLLFSILGGIQAFGFVGLILGPLMFALLVPVVDIYKAILLTREMETRGTASPVSAKPRAKSTA